MLLPQMITNVRIELGDAAQEVWVDDELTRAVEKSVSLMSRLLPKRELLDDVLEAAMIKNSYLLDTSSILSNYIKIERIEYPVNENPPTYPTFDVLRDYVVFRSNVNLTAGETIRLIYLGAWTPPTLSTAGDYPVHLDDVIIVGASGQALIFKAETYTSTAISTLDDAVTALNAITTVTFPTAPDIATDVTAAKTALTAAAATFVIALATAGSIDAPLGSATTSTGNVAARLASGLAFLTTGDDLINVATRGENVGATFGKYADSEAALAREYSYVGGQQVAIAASWEAKAARQGTLGNSYIQEAIQRLAVASRTLEKFVGEVSLSRNKVDYYTTQINKTAQLSHIAEQYLNVAGRYLASGQSKIQEMLAALGYKPEFSSQRALTQRS